MTTGFNPHDITQAALSLQSVILNQALSYVSKYPYYNTEFTAPLEAVTNAVESAYILTAKTDLPKVERRGGFFAIEGGAPLRTQGATPVKYAQERAIAWLAVAQFLEREEKAKAAEEAKAKAAADAAAKAAASVKLARLNDISHLHFGKDYDDLSTNKASAVKEIYRLETIINEDNPKEDAA